MATSGGQPGNKNATKNKRFEDALWREICARDAKRGDGFTLRRIAAAQIESAEKGDLPAAREIADRLDGRPAQALTGADGGPLVIIQATASDETL